jgi:hypothetical protein
MLRLLSRAGKATARLLMEGPDLTPGRGGPFTLLLRTKMTAIIGLDAP